MSQYQDADNFYKSLKLIFFQEFVDHKIFHSLISLIAICQHMVAILTSSKDNLVTLTTVLTAQSDGMWQVAKAVPGL